jgi:hypothetical protein
MHIVMGLTFFPNPQALARQGVGPEKRDGKGKGGNLVIALNKLHLEFMLTMPSLKFVPNPLSLAQGGGGEVLG